MSHPIDLSSLDTWKMTFGTEILRTWIHNSPSPSNHNHLIYSFLHAVAHFGKLPFPKAAVTEGFNVNCCPHAKQIACIKIYRSPEQRDSVSKLYLNNPDLLGSCTCAYRRTPQRRSQAQKTMLVYTYILLEIDMDLIVVERGEEFPSNRANCPHAHLGGTDKP